MNNLYWFRKGIHNEISTASQSVSLYLEFCAHWLNGSSYHDLSDLSDVKDYWSYATALERETIFSVPWCLSSFVDIFLEEGCLVSFLLAQNVSREKHLHKSLRRQLCSPTEGLKGRLFFLGCFLPQWSLGLPLAKMEQVKSFFGSLNNLSVSREPCFSCLYNDFLKIVYIKILPKWFLPLFNYLHQNISLWFCLVD